MDSNQNNTNTQSDVLHFENHSTLSAEDIAKAVQRHNRAHKIGEKKTAPNTKATSKPR
jgi:hypothetical protein